MTATVQGEERDFASEAAAARATLSSDRSTSVCRLREIEEAWARHLLRVPAEVDIAKAVADRVERGLVRTSANADTRVGDLSSARGAAERLAWAEQWQWEIGSWSTGAGEGLASMGKVRSLQVARAWLSAGLALEEIALARSLAEEVEADPNQMGKRHAAALRALRMLLARE